MKINCKPHTAAVAALDFILLLLATTTCNGRLFEPQKRRAARNGRELFATETQKVPLPPTPFWWVENYCRQYHPISWCDCRISEMGPYESPELQKKADVYVFVYPIDGPVNLKLKYEECQQPGVACEWKDTEPGGLHVSAGALGALNKTSDSIDNRYKYSVEGAPNVRYHLSVFDVNEMTDEMCVLKNG